MSEKLYKIKFPFLNNYQNNFLFFPLQIEIYKENGKCSARDHQTGSEFILFACPLASWIKNGCKVRTAVGNTEGMHIFYYYNILSKR